MTINELMNECKMSMKESRLHFANGKMNEYQESKKKYEYYYECLKRYYQNCKEVKYDELITLIQV